MNNPEHNSARRMQILSITVQSARGYSFSTSACFTRPTKTLHLKNSLSALTRTRKSHRGTTRLWASPPEKSKAKHYTINQHGPTQEPTPSVVLRGNPFHAAHPLGRSVPSGLRVLRLWAPCPLARASLGPCAPFCVRPL